jgi:hypothetical protein
VPGGSPSTFPLGAPPRLQGSTAFLILSDRRDEVGPRGRGQRKAPALDGRLIGRHLEGVGQIGLRDRSRPARRGEQDRGRRCQRDEGGGRVVTGILLLGEQLALRSPLPMILGEVTVLAHAVRVLGSIVVRTRVREFLPPIRMIAVLAHAFGVEDAVDVRALGDLAARAPLLLGAFGLLRLPRDTRLAGLFAFGFRLFYSDAGLIILTVQHDQRGLLARSILTLKLLVFNSHDLVITVSRSTLQRRLERRLRR